MKKILTLYLIASFLLLPLPQAQADDSDIFGANIQPNVLIIFDSSGSMSDSVGSLIPYDPAVTYNTPLVYDSAVVYKRARRSSGDYAVYAPTISDVPSASARATLSTSGFWTGRIAGSRLNLYTGNYLNYLACPTCDGLEPKIDIAKRAISSLIQNTDGVRFGVMRFDGNSTAGTGGGGMVATIGTDKAAMISAINAINPSGFTPLGETLDDAGRYFKGQMLRNGTQFASPIQLECQPNFVVLMTDGLQNGTVDVRTEATNRYTQDHASLFAGLQNVIVSTVGFGIAEGERTAANNVLKQAAINGGGNFYYTENSVQLEAAIEDAIRQALIATFSFATPVIPTTSTTGSDRAYLAAFQSSPMRPFWRGFLKVYQRDANGFIPVDSNNVPLSSALVWEAGQQLGLKPAANRRIYTAFAGGRQTFTQGNAGLTPALLGVATGTDRNNVINFVRGIDAYDEDFDSNVTEERAWKLGDIFHSTPVLISPPFSASLDSSYLAFQQAHASRTTVILAGANDGMLHAFRESDGDELWAFVPPDLLVRLKDMTARSGEHLFYVDSSPIAADIKVKGSWKTILVFGERRGGGGYHALDITDTIDPLYLWSFSDPKMTESWSEPTIGKVKMADGTDRFVAFVGGGYDTRQDNNSGKAFFVIDLATGAKLWEYYNAAGSTDDRQFMNFSLAASAKAADLDNDGYIDRVYIGDVGGQLWKFDVSVLATISGGMVTNWTGKRLFAADSSQPNPPPLGAYYPAQAIYSPPALSFDTDHNLWVYFGTGDRNHPLNTGTNRFYGVKDDTDMTNGSALTEFSLVDVTLGLGTNSIVHGWHIRLASNEKVLAAAEVFNQSVLFTTFTPTSTATCGDGGGTAKLYAVDMNTGNAVANLVTGGPPTSALARSADIGTGIPSKPVIFVNLSGSVGNPFAIEGTTNQQISRNPLPPVTLRRLVGWREVF